MDKGITTTAASMATPATSSVLEDHRSAHTPIPFAPATVSEAETLPVLLGLTQTPRTKAERQQQQHELQTNPAMDLGRIELVYRAEGNANLVLALPQFKKVLRLPKLPTSQGSQQQEGGREKGAEFPALCEYVAYIDRWRRLLGMGTAFILDVQIADIPKDADRQWINDSIRTQRPAQRLHKEFIGRYGLLMPDATQLPHPGSVTSASYAQPGPTSNFVSDVFAIEIKPKQGWLLPHEVVFRLLNAKSSTHVSEAEGRAANSSSSKGSKFALKCRYCAMQHLKLQQHKINKLSSYCPLDFFSGSTARMLRALHALFVCPQNNLRIYRNGNLIYGDHEKSLSWQEIQMEIFQGDSSMLEMVKSLLVSCLLREFKEDQEQQHQHSSNAAPSTAAAPVMLTPQREFETGGQPDCVLYSPSYELKGPDEQQCKQQASEGEMLSLPKNCILQKVLHLQLLAKHQLAYMLDEGYAEHNSKTYNILRSLLTLPEGALTFETLTPEMAYLLGATAMDCSIMISFTEAPHGLQDTSMDVVHVAKYNRSFLCNVKLLDLDPKPDSHLCKYVKQTREAYEACNACYVEGGMLKEEFQG